jgi:hypothetical protein
LLHDLWTNAGAGSADVASSTFNTTNSTTLTTALGQDGQHWTGDHLRRHLSIRINRRTSRSLIAAAPPKHRSITCQQAPAGFDLLSRKTDGSRYGQGDRGKHGRKPAFSDGQRGGISEPINHPLLAEAIW